MIAPDRFKAMVEACIANHEEIMRYGSAEMQTASRMLLFALAAEIKRKSRDIAQASDDVD